MLQGRHPFRAVTWLAMLAMALIVVMPVLSRSLPMTGMDMGCPVHQAAATHHPASPHAPADPTERCGYCALLNHTPPLASGAVVYLAPTAPMPALTPWHDLGEAPASPRLSADPRGPPSAV